MSPKQEAALPHRPVSPVIFRGEKDGELRQLGGIHHPWFFTERPDHALLYSGKNNRGIPHKPIAYRLANDGSTKVLDLTNLRPTNKDHIRLLELLTEEFRSEGWVCRYTGEEREAYSFIEGGDLYDYEGTGTGERWNRLFEIAFSEMEFDAVRLPDRTDGTQGAASIVWVTHRKDLLRPATMGEELAALIHRPKDRDGFIEESIQWPLIERWIEQQHPDLIERIQRLTCIDEDNRLDLLQEKIPARELRKIDRRIHQSVWRALPNGTDIRPGDWVTLSRNYAQQHQRNDGDTVEQLQRVLASDISWSGTDNNEFFYLPQAWVKPGITKWQDYLLALTPEQIQILCDGEMHEIRRHTPALRQIQQAISADFNQEACGYYHGPDHWGRVSQHAVATARSLGINPLIPHLFGMVHDSQREDEGHDPGHGPRAAAWVAEHAHDLFHFLSPQDIDLLALACELHSEGETEGPPQVQACWDADRLDLWRVGIEPNPRYLSCDYSKNPHVIADADRFMKRMPSHSCTGRLDAHEDCDLADEDDDWGEESGPAAA